MDPPIADSCDLDGTSVVSVSGLSKGRSQPHRHKDVSSVSPECLERPLRDNGPI